LLRWCEEGKAGVSAKLVRFSLIPLVAMQNRAAQWNPLAILKRSLTVNDDSLICPLGFFNLFPLFEHSASNCSVYQQRSVI